MNMKAIKVAADCISRWVVSPTQRLMRCRHRLVFMHKLMWIVKEKSNKKENDNNSSSIIER